jgi:hypothetical protein
MIFLRQAYTELWITLTSNEVLGILDSDYLEDYYGTDGQITLHNLTTGERIPVLMTEVFTTTPEIPHDVFTGFIELAPLTNGEYQIEGRVKDVFNHHTIIGEVQNPFGSERIISLPLTITETDVIIEFGDLARITAGISVTAAMLDIISTDSGMIEFLNFQDTPVQNISTNVLTTISFITPMETYG